MFAPDEVAKKKFDKTVGRGYRVDQVEEYLGELATNMAQLSQEKRDLEKKLEILADKLEEYRQDEDSLRSALLGAQKLGDSVIRESKTKAEIIMRDATIKAEKMVDSASRQIEKEQLSLAKMQKEVASFKNRLFALYRQHLELIGALPGDGGESPVPGKERTQPKEPVASQEPVASEPAARSQRGQPEQKAEEPSPQQPSHLEESHGEEPPRHEFFKIDFEKGSPESSGENSESPAEPSIPTKKPESRFSGKMMFGEGFELVREDEGSQRKRR